MAVETAADYLTKAGNLSGLGSVSTARTNLGLGTMAVETASNYLTTSAASSTYLTTGAAASTYQTVSGMTSYLSVSTAASTYQPISSMASYLTTASAASSYALLSSFDQGVKTTDNPTFASITATNYVSSTVLDHAGLEFAAGNTLSDTSTMIGNVQHSGGGGHIDALNYPDEVTITINGVTYAMPARAV